MVNGAEPCCGTAAAHADAALNAPDRGLQQTPMDPQSCQQAGADGADTGRRVGIHPLDDRPRPAMMPPDAKLAQGPCLRTQAGYATHSVQKNWVSQSLSNASRMNAAPTERHIEQRQGAAHKTICQSNRTTRSKADAAPSPPRERPH